MTQLKSINQAIANQDNVVLFVYQYSLAETNQANYIKHVTLEELVEKFEVTLDELLERSDSNVDYFRDQPHDDRPGREYVNEVNAFSYEFLRDKNVLDKLHFETSTDVIDLYIIKR